MEQAQRKELRLKWELQGKKYRNKFQELGKKKDLTDRKKKPQGSYLN